jgi:uncharacterized surface protein with fasciclin (FAS1) repeats
MAKFAAVLMMALVASCGLAGARNLKQAPAPGPASVVDLVASNPDFTILAAAVTALDLAGALGPDFAGTVFAPTNEAFMNLLAELGVASPVDLLSTSPDLVAQVLKLHVSPVKAMAADLSVGAMLPTLEGSDITVETLMPTVTITAGGNTATVTTTDIMAGNAVVHIIDTVLLPGSAAPAPAPMAEADSEE